MLTPMACELKLNVTLDVVWIDRPFVLVIKTVGIVIIVLVSPYLSVR